MGVPYPVGNDRPDEASEANHEEDEARDANTLGDSARNDGGGGGSHQESVKPSEKELARLGDGTQEGWGVTPGPLGAHEPGIVRGGGDPVWAEAHVSQGPPRKCGSQQVGNALEDDTTA